MTTYPNINVQILFTILTSFILALLLSLYGVRIVVRTVNKLNLFDKPNERSSADKPTPTLGGIAIFFSFILISTLEMSGYELTEMTYIRTAILLIFFVGLKDDLVALPPHKKIIAQIMAAFIITFLAEIRFTNLHGLFGIGTIGVIPSVIISCFTIIVIINAFNLMDGIDGLAAGLTIMAALIFGSWFFISGHFGYAILSFSLGGAVAGFFYYNLYGKRYKIFMGDTGSLVLGTIISILVIRFNEFNIDQNQPFAIASAPAVSFGILAYPLIDTLRVMAIRIKNRKSPFSSDKNHFHHRLLTLGFSHKNATYTIIVFSILFTCFIFAMHHLGIHRLTFYIAIIGGIFAILPDYFIKNRNLIKKDDPVQQLLISGWSDKKSVSRSHFIKGRKEKSQFPLVNRQTFFQKLNLW